MKIIGRYISPTTILCPHWKWLMGDNRPECRHSPSDNGLNCFLSITHQKYQIILINIIHQKTILLRIIISSARMKYHRSHQGSIHCKAKLVMWNNDKQQPLELLSSLWCYLHLSWYFGCCKILKGSTPAPFLLIPKKVEIFPHYQSKTIC